MVYDKIYNDYIGVDFVKKIIGEEVDIELLTPKQLKAIYKTTIKILQNYDKTKEYLEPEATKFEVEALNRFIEENWSEALI